MKIYKRVFRLQFVSNVEKVLFKLKVKNIRDFVLIVAETNGGILILTKLNVSQSMNMFVLFVKRNFQCMEILRENIAVMNVI